MQGCQPGIQGHRGHVTYPTGVHGSRGKSGARASRHTFAVLVARPHASHHPHKPWPATVPGREWEDCTPHPASCTPHTPMWPLQPCHGNVLLTAHVLFSQSTPCAGLPTAKCQLAPPTCIRLVSKGHTGAALALPVNAGWSLGLLAACLLQGSLASGPVPLPTLQTTVATTSYLVGFPTHQSP